MYRNDICQDILFYYNFLFLLYDNLLTVFLKFKIRKRRGGLILTKNKVIMITIKPNFSFSENFVLNLPDLY